MSSQVSTKFVTVITNDLKDMNIEVIVQNQSGPSIQKQNICVTYSIYLN